MMMGLPIVGFRSDSRVPLLPYSQSIKLVMSGQSLSHTVCSAVRSACGCHMGWRQPWLLKNT